MEKIYTKKVVLRGNVNSIHIPAAIRDEIEDIVTVKGVISGEIPIQYSPVRTGFYAYIYLITDKLETNDFVTISYDEKTNELEIKKA